MSWPERTLAQRFWTKVDQRGPDECWPWTAATNEHGYGVISAPGRANGPSLKAHRVSADLAGQDVTGRVVRHRCDNPPCVNPRHLIVGTQSQNIADMYERGRARIGSAKGQSPLNEHQVAEIRRRAAAGEMQKVLAVEYGVGKMTISRIVNRRTWRHVP